MNANRTKENSDHFDHDPSLLINSNFNISNENKTIAGKLLTHIYTNTTFLDNPAAFIRVRSFFPTPVPGLSEN